MNNTVNPDNEFYSNYPGPIREFCSFIHFLLLTGMLFCLGVLWFWVTIVAPIVMVSIVAMFLLRGAGLMP